MARARLTDAALRALAGPDEVWDEVVPGFGVVVLPSGTKTYFVRYRFAGRNRRFKIGRYPIVPLANARKEARRLLAEVAAGNDPQGERIAQRRRQSLEDVARSYFVAAERAGKVSAGAERAGFRRHILPRIGHLPIEEVRRRDILPILDDLLAAGKDTTANRMRGVLSVIFAWATERELCETNIVRDIRKPAPERRRDRVLSDEEIAVFWGELKEYAEPTASLLRVLLLLLQRSTETRLVRWQDVVGDVWTIPKALHKSRRGHTVPLVEPAAGIIAAQSRLSMYVFRGARGGALSQAAVKAAVLRLQQRCRFHFTAHDLRRTGATRMTELGIPRFIVARVLGHADAGVTAIYDRNTYEREKREALATWGAHVQSLVRI